VRLTGDIAAAAQFIGDTDLRVVSRSYLKRRDDQLRAVADRLDLAHAQDRKVNESATVAAEEFSKLAIEREPLVGFEPTTARLRIESSTPELQWPVSNAGAHGGAPPIHMPWRGFEPRRLSALPPQDSVSTSFTTRACGGAR
jgi:hypothetical protein